MIAVVVERPGKVGIQRVDDPTPGPREVLVQVEACGICGTDIHILEGELPPTRYPIVPGHEFCGELVAVGHDVKHVRVGDFVAVDPNLPCRECRFCQAGRENLCENYDAIGVTRAGGARNWLPRPPPTRSPFPPACRARGARWWSRCPARCTASTGWTPSSPTAT